MDSVNFIVNSLEKRIEGYKKDQINYQLYSINSHYDIMTQYISRKMICKMLEDILSDIKNADPYINGMTLEEYIKSKVNEISSSLLLNEIPLEKNANHIMKHNADIFVLTLLTGYLDKPLYTLSLIK